MSDEKKYSLRDMVLAQREAALTALAYFNVYETTRGGREASEAFVKKQFPLPTVTRPRVVTDSQGRRWRFEDGAIIGDDCSASAGWVPKPERVRIWADLLARPTETVDDDS